MTRQPRVIRTSTMVDDGMGAVVMVLVLVMTRCGERADRERGKQGADDELLDVGHGVSGVGCCLSGNGFKTQG
jgi:hypothetical protein